MQDHAPILVDRRPGLLSAEAAAAVSGLDRDFVQGLIDKGTLQAVETAAGLRTTLHELRRYCKKEGVTMRPELDDDRIIFG